MIKQINFKSFKILSNNERTNTSQQSSTIKPKASSDRLVRYTALAGVVGVATGYNLCDNIKQRFDKIFVQLAKNCLLNPNKESLEQKWLVPRTNKLLGLKRKAKNKAYLIAAATGIAISGLVYLMNHLFDMTNKNIKTK